jgi:DNA-binding beta-propeller fold protein YncE
VNRNASLVLLSLTIGSAFPVHAQPDLIVSTNDAKYVRVTGKDTFPAHPGPDTLSVIDASTFPPRITATVEVVTSIAGPPQAVAITPNGRLAIVSAPNRYDYQEKKIILETFLQVVDLEAKPPRVIGKLDVGHHPQGLAINREGTLLLAATLGGTVAVVTIKDKTRALQEQVKIAERRLAGVSFTHDGKSALVALRDEQGVMVLNVDGTKVTTDRERIASGVAPYAIDISSDGRWPSSGTPASRDSPATSASSSAMRTRSLWSMFRSVRSALCSTSACRRFPKRSRFRRTVVGSRRRRWMVPTCRRTTRRGVRVAGWCCSS